MSTEARRPTEQPPPGRRVLTIVCSALSHEPQALGELIGTEARGDRPETWEVGTGSEIESQALLDQREADDDALDREFYATRDGLRLSVYRGARRTRRYVIRCPRCDDNVTIGDRLGIGGATVKAHADWREANPRGRRPLDDVLPRLATYERLTAVANYGESCISLAMLRRIVSM